MEAKGILEWTLISECQIPAKVQLWTRMRIVKDKLCKGIDVRRIDKLLASTILK